MRHQLKVPQIGSLFFAALIVGALSVGRVIPGFLKALLTARYCADPSNHGIDVLYPLEENSKESEDIS
ncbi:MAG: hypothetical protein AAF065_07870 [Verrucomicrobiota bacterium]